MTPNRPILSSLSIAIPFVALASLRLLHRLPSSVALFGYVLPPTLGILAASASFVRGERPGCLSFGAIILNFLYMLGSQVVVI